MVSQDWFPFCCHNDARLVAKLFNFKESSTCLRNTYICTKLHRLSVAFITHFVTKLIQYKKTCHPLATRGSVVWKTLVYAIPNTKFLVKSKQSVPVSRSTLLSYIDRNSKVAAVHLLEQTNKPGLSDIRIICKELRRLRVGYLWCKPDLAPGGNHWIRARIWLVCEFQFYNFGVFYLNRVTGKMSESL